MIDAAVIDEFRQAGKAFADLVARVGPDDADRIALGVWSVRDLVGHTSRALLTVEECLAAPAPESEVFFSSADYFALAASADHDEIAQRGREAGLALGDIPSHAVAIIRTRSLMALQRAIADGSDRLVETRFGGILLSAYLPTRTFELVVHTLDLASTLGVDAGVPDAPLRSAAHLALDIALAAGLGPSFVLTLTGRSPASPT
ncbi:MAG: maleylpyruvate isomerase N-terminal domain-containing protein [Acidimicrobiales bacterium]